MEMKNIKIGATYRNMFRERKVTDITEEVNKLGFGYKQVSYEEFFVSLHGSKTPMKGGKMPLREFAKWVMLESK